MSIEVLEGLNRKVTLSLKKDEIDALVKDKLKAYAKSAKIQGFRPGRAPMNMIEKIYGSQAFEEILNAQINQNFSEIVKENKLNLVDAPQFDLTSSDGDAYILSATFEIIPEVKIGELSNQEVEQPTCDVTPEIIGLTIDKLKQSKATYVEETKPAANGDKVIIDFVGTVDGEEFQGGKASAYPFVLGQKAMLPDFEEGILGLVPGETRQVEINFPENYHAENLKGKKALFKITLISVSKPQLPELDETFIKDLGVNAGTVDSLHQEIKTNLEREVKRRTQVKFRENLLTALINSSEFEVPHTMIHNEIHHMIDGAKKNMLEQGYKEEQIKLTHDMFKDSAKRNVKLRLLILQFIQDHNLTTNEEDLKAVVENLAASYEDPQEYLSWYFQDEKRVSDARAIAMENKVTTLIASQVKLKSNPVNYEGLMQQQI